MLHNQNNDASGYGNLSQKFDTAHASDNSQGADDFTVPSGKTWTITEVDVTGFYSPTTAKATSENVIFYKNTVNIKKQDVPGTKIKSVTLKGTDTSGKFAISGITGVKLAAGHYWVSVQANMSYSTGFWYWESRTVQSGSPAVWENPGNGTGANCTTWTIKQTCAGSHRPARFHVQPPRHRLTPPDGAAGASVQPAPCGVCSHKSRPRSMRPRADLHRLGIELTGPSGWT